MTIRSSVFADNFTRILYDEFGSHRSNKDYPFNQMGKMKKLPAHQAIQLERRLSESGRQLL
jgi:hypothetical protein